MSQVKPIPDGMHSIIPHLVVRGATRAIEFYKKAFGAVELTRMPMPDGKTLMHVHLKIGDSHLFLVDEMPNMGQSKGPQSLGGTPVTLHFYTENVDATFNRAIGCGCQVLVPPTDMFWGDRYSKLADPFGHHWSIATHKEDPTPEEMQRRAAVMFSQAPAKH